MYRFLLVLLFIPFLSSAKVKIDYLGNTLSYSGNPRLDQVLTNLVSSVDYYWLNAHLYDREDPQAARLKREVLEALTKIITNSGSKTQKWQDIKTIEKQIKSWKVATKIPLYIDHDLARVKEEFNPKLDDGHYFLSLPFRSNKITVFGAVSQETALAHIGGASVEAYLGQLELLDYADSEFVYVIRPDGGYIKVSTGMHNIQHVEVSPGGAIYIPIRELPFLSTNETLNDMIATLAGNRLP